MTLTKAIEILETEQRCLEFKGATDRRDANKLGIEALKRIYNNRASLPGSNFIPLLGESKE